jgi:Icc-related predicted phosphoesterase
MVSMKILYTADTHVHPGHLERFLKAAKELNPQVLIIGGDIIPDWKGSIEASIEPHKTWVRQVLLPRLKEFHETSPEVPVFLDLGNDDIAAARSLMEACDGVELHLLHRRVVRIGERLGVAGYMTVNPTPFAIKDGEKPDCRDHDGLSQPRVVRAGYVTNSGKAMPYQLDPMAGTVEDDLDKLSAVLESPSWLDFSFLFVCHAPPKDTALDQMATGSHVGSLAVRRFIERWSLTGRLIASFHGHIHESPWTSGRTCEHIGNVPCFNVGQNPQMLRALLLDTEAIPDSARLVTVSRSKEVTVASEGRWL